MNKLFPAVCIVLCVIIGVQVYDSYKKGNESPCIDTLATGTIISVTTTPKFLSTVFFDQTNKMLKVDLSSTTDKAADERSKNKFKVGKVFKLCYVIE